MELSNYWENKKEFLKKYTENFLPYLKQHDDEIKKVTDKYNFYKKLYYFFMYFLLIIALLIFLLAPILVNIFVNKIHLTTKTFDISFRIYLICLFACIFFVNKNSCSLEASSYSLNKLKDTIKRSLMPIFCKCFEELSWSQGFYYDSKILTMSEFSKFNKDSIGIDDVFYGTAEGINFDIIETYAYNPKNPIPCWDSICIRVRTDKKFSSNTYIVSKNRGRNKFSSIINKFYTKINILIGKMCNLDIQAIETLCNDFHFTNLEDVVFQKKFDVYTDDDVEARYLITPAFMQRIANIEKKFNSQIQRVEFCWGRELLIFLKTNKDCFELFSIDNKTDNKTACFKIFDEIASIYNLIDYIKNGLVFNAKTNRQRRLSAAEKNERRRIYREITKAKATVSFVLGVLYVIISIIILFCFATINFNAFKNVCGEAVGKIIFIAFLVFIISIYAIIFVTILKIQLDKQSDRFEYMGKIL